MRPLLAVAFVASFAAGCGSSSSREEGTRGGKLDWAELKTQAHAFDETAMSEWRRTILGNAHRETLRGLRDSSQATLATLAERDAELAERPPYLVAEARSELRLLAVTETERLRLIDERLAGR